MKKKAKSNLSSENCLICLNLASKRPRQRSTVTITENNILENNLIAIYVLRELLNYPQTNCCQLLEQNDGIKGPGDWFQLCAPCSKVVQEAFELNRNILQLTGKLNGLKGKLEMCFKNSLTKAGRKKVDRRGQHFRKIKAQTESEIIRKYFKDKTFPVRDTPKNKTPQLIDDVLMKDSITQTDDVYIEYLGVTPDGDINNISLIDNQTQTGDYFEVAKYENENEIEDDSNSRFNCVISSVQTVQKLTKKARISLMRLEDQICQDETGLSIEIPEDDKTDQNETNVCAQDDLQVPETNNDCEMEIEDRVGVNSKLNNHESHNQKVESETNEDEQSLQGSDCSFPDDSENNSDLDNPTLFSDNDKIEMEDKLNTAKIVLSNDTSSENRKTEAASEIEHPIATINTLPENSSEAVDVELNGADTDDLKNTTATSTRSSKRLKRTPVNTEIRSKISRRISSNPVEFTSSNKHKRCHSANSKLSSPVIGHSTFPSTDEPAAHKTQRHRTKLRNPPKSKAKSSKTPNSKTPTRDSYRTLNNKSTEVVLDGKTYYQCIRKECSYQTSCRSSMHKHHFVHKLEDFMTINWGENKCKICDHTSSSRLMMRKHVRKEHFKEVGLSQDTTLSTEFLCSICGKCFPYQSDVRRHAEKVHEKKYNFHCDVCGGGYNELGRLEYHKARNHPQPSTECAKVICEHCGMEFSGKYSLKSHLKRFHNPNSKSSKPRSEGGVMCVTCGVGCANHFALNKHRRATHPELYKFKCTQCSAVYAHRILLHQHLDSAHRDPSAPKLAEAVPKIKVKCPQCDKTLAKKSLSLHLEESCKRQKK